jgi:hypothetical protein
MVSRLNASGGGVAPCRTGTRSIHPLSPSYTQHKRDGTAQPAYVRLLLITAEGVQRIRTHQSILDACADCRRQMWSSRYVRSMSPATSLVPMTKSGA